MMEVSQKRTCAKCRAYWDNSHNSCCWLGYKTEKRYIMHFVFVGLTPLEPCPKPTTWKEYDASKNPPTNSRQ